MPALFETADVQRAAGGDHAAFERLYRDHVGRVYALCVRMVDEQSAEDLTQEVFIRVWSKLDTFKGQAPVRDVAAPPGGEPRTQPAGDSTET